MTEQHISHPEGLPACAAGHSARHIHDQRGLTAGSSHLVECRCRATSKHAEAEAALAEGRRINRALRGTRKVPPKIAVPSTDNMVQLAFLTAAPPGRVAGGGHWRR